MVTTIERVDIDDDGTFAALHDVYARALNRDVDQPYTAREMRADMRPDEYVATVMLLARDADGAAVAGGTAELPLRDNTGFVYVDVFTAPEHRRLGHGATVIEALEKIGRGADRSIMHGEAVWELAAEDPASQAFAVSVGFTLDIMDAMRELPLPATLPALDVADGYSIHTWRGACPERWVEGYTDLRQLINEEAPRGDAGLQNEFWDVARTRAEEAMWADQGRTPQVSIAVSQDGEVVGHTQLLFSSGSPNAYQWDTLVLPTHRGHGLGLALKVTTMQESADLLEGRRRIVTYNAAGNEAMIRVNEALGFRQTAWVGEYVKEL